MSLDQKLSHLSGAKFAVLLGLCLLAGVALAAGTDFYFGNGNADSDDDATSVSGWMFLAAMLTVAALMGWVLNRFGKS